MCYRVLNLSVCSQFWRGGEFLEQISISAKLKEGVIVK